MSHQGSSFPYRNSKQLSNLKKIGPNIPSKQAEMTGWSTKAALTQTELTRIHPTIQRSLQQCNLPPNIGYTQQVRIDKSVM